jgi:hypothetical protein
MSGKNLLFVCSLFSLLSLSIAWGNASGQCLKADCPDENGLEIVTDKYYNGIEIKSPEGTGLRILDASFGMHIEHGGDGIVMGSYGNSNPYQYGTDYDIKSTGIYIMNAGVAGIRIGKAGVNGIYIDKAGDSGVEIGSSDESGISIGHAKNGIKIEDVGESGISIGRAEGSGISIGRAKNGIQINSVDENFIEAGSNFLVDTNGRVWSSGSRVPAGFAELMTTEENSTTGYESGNVLVISDSKDRSVELSNKSYSATVIGVYSGNPGIVGSSHPMKDAQGNELPVAVMGIVPCKVSAENGAIHRGDILTTSSTPGHAMKASDIKPGTILGKALGELESGTGMIDIMVTLQ